MGIKSFVQYTTGSLYGKIALFTIYIALWIEHGVLEIKANERCETSNPSHVVLSVLSRNVRI